MPAAATETAETPGRSIVAKISTLPTQHQEDSKKRYAEGDVGKGTSRKKARRHVFPYTQLHW
jgi:hypothetical protein